MTPDVGQPFQAVSQPIPSDIHFGIAAFNKGFEGGANLNRLLEYPRPRRGCQDKDADLSFAQILLIPEIGVGRDEGLVTL
jgi:hypothetical protein